MAIKINLDINKFLDKIKRRIFKKKYEISYLRKRLGEQEFEDYIDACALAVLSEEVVGISDHGTIPDVYLRKRPSVKWALERVQYRHAWVVCGLGGGMEDFLKRMDQDSRFASWTKRPE